MRLSDIERRALLGDQQAQIHLAKAGIALPCPKCGKSCVSFETIAKACALDPKSSAYQILSKYYAAVCDGYKGGCGLFICAVEENSKESALIEWNERPAPPVGRCKECTAYVDHKCTNVGYYTPENGYCNDFEPREDEENG